MSDGGRLERGPLPRRVRVCALPPPLTAASHLGLGRLIVLYDDNQISIDGATDLALTEDIDRRFEACGFHCQHVADGDADLDGIAAAILRAQQATTKPSLIRIR